MSQPNDEPFFDCQSIGVIFHWSHCQRQQKCQKKLTIFKNLVILNFQNPLLLRTEGVFKKTEGLQKLPKKN